MRDYTFYMYIITNPAKSALYIGFTENLERRLSEHIENKGSNDSFAGKYHCTNLIYFEVYQYVSEAIAREKQLKRWSRKKKEWLINQSNPKWDTLNLN